jgi:T-complex protein 1 subunit eta
LKQIVDAEWEILYEKLRKIEASGAKIVLSRLPIGDVATQWFADRYVFSFSFVVCVLCLGM